jgi:hypothetical protein
MENYKVLIAALYPYRNDMDLDNIQRYSLLEKDIRGGFINLDQLRTELITALSDPAFDWVAFARENLLIIDSSDAVEIAAYVKSIFRDFIVLK